MNGMPPVPLEVLLPEPVWAGAAVTRTVRDAAAPPPSVALQRMVAFPAFNAVIFPPDAVATDGSEDVQVRDLLAASVGRTWADTVADFPCAREREETLKVI